LGVSRSVDVAKGTVSHLLDQNPPFQTRIIGKLASALTLLGDNALQHFGVDVSPFFLVLSGDVGGDIFCSRGYIAVVDGSGGEVVMDWRGSMLVFVINEIRLAHSAVSSLPHRLVLGMDIRNIGSGLGVGSSGLFSMADEVLEVLYRRHDDRFAVVDKRRPGSVGEG
jgi:hypothetical protein